MRRTILMLAVVMRQGRRDKGQRQKRNRHAFFQNAHPGMIPHHTGGVERELPVCNFGLVSLPTDRQWGNPMIPCWLLITFE